MYWQKQIITNSANQQTWHRIKNCRKFDRVEHIFRTLFWGNEQWSMICISSSTCGIKSTWIHHIVVPPNVHVLQFGYLYSEKVLITCFCSTRKQCFAAQQVYLKNLFIYSYVGWNNFGLNLFTVHVEDICSLIFKAHTVQHNISQVSPLSLSLRWHESVQLCGQMSKCTYEVCVLRNFFFVYIPKYILCTY